MIMASSISVKPNLVLSPFPRRTATQNPLFHGTQFGHKPFFRGSLSVTKFGTTPDPESSDGVVKELFGLFGGAENLLSTIADATVSSSEAITTSKQNSDWLSGITNIMETILKVLKDGLSTLHVPYSYGFAIILLTVLVKAATFPLTTKQVESAMAMRSLAPQVKAIQERYAGDQERIQLETARLYKLAGINPLAGCLPTLATIPVWIGLYRALSNVANEGLLTEGFFWIPSLAGPTTIATRQSGSGISWLFPFVSWHEHFSQDGDPPLGWSDTLAYLVLPVLLVVSQYISVQIMQSSQSNDPNMKSSQTVTKFLPLMVGYFSLSVPSGLSLYWFTNNILSTAQQIWLQKFGGAKNPMKQFSDVTKEDQVDILKSVSGLNSTRKESRQGEDLTVGLRPGDRFKQIKALEGKQGEKLTAEGLRPGDRFKQIKEQEARRRQQREEEKRKAAEVAAKGNQTSHEGDEREANVQERANGTGTDLLDEKNENFQSVKAQDVSNIGVIVNSNISGLEFKEDKTMSVLRTEDCKVAASSEVNGRDEQQSCDDIEKEAVELHTTSDNKPFEEDARDARRE